MRKWIILIALAFFTISLFPNSNVTAANSTLSVKLINYVGDRNNLDFLFTGEYSISGDSSLMLTPNKKYTIKIEQDKLALYDQSEKIGEFESTVTINPKSYSTSNKITLYGNTAKTYLGTMKFDLESGENIRPTNINIPFEDYLKGVVPHEMPALWQLEALKAQAVSARSYAVSSGYVGKVITDTQTHQVYGGYHWYPNSTKAVVDTTDQLLTYNGNAIATVYSSSNGGVTESNTNAWSSPQLPYYPVKNDPYDPKNPWSVTINKTQINLSGNDLSKPSLWWNKVFEKDTTISNNIKSYLIKNGYSGKEFKIVSIPEFTVNPQKNSSGRSLGGSIKVYFFVKDIKNNNFIMENGVVKKHTFESDLSMTSIRSIIGTTLIKSNLVDKYTNSTTKRLGGKDRFEVAVNVSKQGWSKSDTVVIANYLAYADALSATPLAYQENAPILLTHPDKLTDTTEAEIKRLEAKKVIIVGGPPSVSSNVTKRLEQLGISWERLGGHDRYEVSYNVAKKLGKTNTAVVAYGLVFSDALSIAPYAAKNGYPILLTKTNVLPPETTKALKENNITETVVSGGEPSVGKSVYSKLPSPIRMDGKDRYEVAANIANNLGFGSTNAFVATGLTFADALTGSVLAAKQNAPMLLTRPTSLPDPIADYINGGDTSNFIILGGESSVSQSIVSKLPNDSYSLVGRGFGHGVGMSQYGANGMANSGKNYKEILNFYFPGTKVE